MHNENESKKLIELMTYLSNEGDMIGWLCTVHRNVVRYKDLNATKKVQNQLNRAHNFVTMAYMWAILEEHGFNENNKWISEEMREELKAWKHVRHTGVHSPNGRANVYRNEFDKYMQKKASSISGLRENCFVVGSSIELKDGMDFRFFAFAFGLVKSAIGHCANGIAP